jgi:hypothetical protein
MLTIEAPRAEVLFPQPTSEQKARQIERENLMNVARTAEGHINNFVDHVLGAWEKPKGDPSRYGEKIIDTDKGEYKITRYLDKRFNTETTRLSLTRKQQGEHEPAIELTMNEGLADDSPAFSLLAKSRDTENDQGIEIVSVNAHMAPTGTIAELNRCEQFAAQVIDETLRMNMPQQATAPTKQAA